ncbi:MAG TPA: GGDEF domain-containing protein [Casimicrobiaceae bacterium]|nr:GGDEF domain-containing protein [Casimicrobiaceae bacterium]
MMNARKHHPFAQVFDQVTRGGRGSAARALEDAMATIGDAGDTPVGKALGAIAGGSRNINAGRYEDALRVIIPALDELERSVYSERLGWLHAMVGFAVGMMGNPERGLEWTGRALAAVDATPTSIDRLTAYSNHGCLLGMAGEHDASREHLEQALRIAVSAGNVEGQHIALSNISYGLLMKLRESDALSATQKTSLARQSLECAERARRLSSGEASGLDPGGLDSLVGQAMVHAGHIAQAKLMFAQALRAGVVNPGVSAEAHLGIAMAHRLSAEYDEARVHLHVAQDIATTARLSPILDRVMAEGALLETADGNLAGALDWSTRRCGFLERHYRERLRLLARSTELATQADSVSQRASHYRKEAESLHLTMRDWDDEGTRDALTDAFNRRGLARVAGHVFAPRRQLSTVVINIDHFTLFNESYGRTAGDKVLKEVAATIAAHMRNADQLARADGGEFQLLLPDTSPEAALDTAEQIRAAIGRERSPGSSDAGITVSIGICNRSSERSFEATLAAADRALEQARKSGCNRTCVA